MKNPNKDNFIAFISLAIIFSPIVLIGMFMSNSGSTTDAEYEQSRQEALDRAWKEADEDICRRAVSRLDMCQKTK